MTFKTVSRLLILVVLTVMTLQTDARGGAPNGTQQEDVSGQSARGYIAPLSSLRRLRARTSTITFTPFTWLARNAGSQTCRLPP
jgi:hypothetical protein